MRGVSAPTPSNPLVCLACSIIVARSICVNRFIEQACCRKWPVATPSYLQISQNRALMVPILTTCRQWIVCTETTVMGRLATSPGKRAWVRPSATGSAPDVHDHSVGAGLAAALLRLLPVWHGGSLVRDLVVSPGEPGPGRCRLGDVIGHGQLHGRPRDRQQLGRANGWQVAAAAHRLRRAGGDGWGCRQAPSISMRKSSEPKSEPDLRCLLLVEPPAIRELRYIHPLWQVGPAEFVPINNAGVAAGIQRELVIIP